MRINYSSAFSVLPPPAGVWRALRFSVEVLIITALLGCVQAGTQEPRGANDTVSTKLDTILDRGTLRVGTTGDFVPFSYRKTPTSRYEGIDIELATDLAATLEVDVVFVPTRWGDLMADLLNDRFDIGVGGITITSARRRLAFFSEPTSTNGKVAISRDENVHRFDTLAEINQAGVRVIVNPGGTNEAFSREHFPHATIVVNKDNVTIFENLVTGVGDVMVTDRIEAKIQERLHPELEVANPDAPFNTFEFGFLLPRDRALKAFVDTWLGERKNDGTFQRIFERELQKATFTSDKKKRLRHGP